MADFYAKLKSKFNEDGMYNTTFSQYAREQTFIEQMALMNVSAFPDAKATGHGQRFEYAISEFIGVDYVHLADTQNADWDATTRNTLISMKIQEGNEIQMSYLASHAVFIDSPSTNNIDFLVVSYNKKKDPDFKEAKLHHLSFSKARWNEIIAGLVQYQPILEKEIKRIENLDIPSESFSKEKRTHYAELDKILGQAKQANVYNMTDGRFSWAITKSIRELKELKIADGEQKKISHIATDLKLSANLQGLKLLASQTDMYKYPGPHDQEAIDFIFFSVLPKDWLVDKNSPVYKAIIAFGNQKPKPKNNFWFKYNEKRIKEIEGKE